LALNPENKLSIFLTGNGILMGQSFSDSWLMIKYKIVNRKTHSNQFYSGYSLSNSLDI
jgi:hypothetical protein